MPRKISSFILAVAIWAIVVMLAAGLSAQTETILHSFTGGSDGGFPYAGLAKDSKGNLYGTAQSGGANSAGVVFELSPGSNGAWTYNVIYNFTGFFGTGDGAFPSGGVTFDGKGNLYGVTSFAGANSEGTIYELSPGTNGAWTERVLYSFTGTSDGGNGLYVAEGLTIDGAGNLYGESQSEQNGSGVIFELTPGAGGIWTFSIVHTFTGASDGGFPYSRLALDPSGHLYGAASSGGAHDYGALFELVPGSNGVWTEKIVHAFTGGTGGSTPISGLTIAKTGSFI